MAVPLPLVFMFSIFVSIFWGHWFRQWYWCTFRVAPCLGGWGVPTLRVLVVEVAVNPSDSGRQGRGGRDVLEERGGGGGRVVRSRVPPQASEVGSGYADAIGGGQAPAPCKRLKRTDEGESELNCPPPSPPSEGGTHHFVKGRHATPPQGQNERPTGASKGKQPDTEALSPPPPRDRVGEGLRKILDLTVVCDAQMQVPNSLLSPSRRAATFTESPKHV